MPERIALTVAETAEALDISRTSAYELIRRGDLPHIRIGRVIRVPAEALMEWVITSTTTTKAGTP